MLMCSLMTLNSNNNVSSKYVDKTILNANVVATRPTGDGSEEKPFKLSNLQNFIWLQNNYHLYDNAFYSLTNNIDFKDYEWSPIGSEEKPFIGTIYSIMDNNRHPLYHLKNIKIYSSSYNNIGFFGYTKNSNFYNIGIENLNIDLPDDYQCNSLGGFVGHGVSTYFENIRVEGTIKGSLVSHIGGIVGALDSSGPYSELRYCYSNVDITGKDDIGGLVGFSEATMLQVEECAADVKLSGDNNIGGLVGRLESSTGNINVDNCYAIGTITGTGNNIDSAFGKLKKSDIINIDACYTSVDVGATSPKSITTANNCYSYGTGVNCQQFFENVSSISILNSYFDNKDAFVIIDNNTLPQLDCLDLSNNGLSAPNDLVIDNYSEEDNDNYYFDNLGIIEVDGDDDDWFDNIKSIYIENDGRFKTLKKGTATLEGSSYVLSEGDDYAIVDLSSGGYIIFSFDNFYYLGNKVSIASKGYELTSRDNEDMNINVTLRPGSTKITSISASINLNEAKIYSTDSLDDVKKYITVKAMNIDGTSAGKIANNDYSLSGDISTPSNHVELIIAYNNFNTSLVVKVLPPIETIGISVVFTPGTVTFTEDDNVETLKQYLSITLLNSDGSEGDTYSAEELNCSLVGRLKQGICTITVTYLDYTATFKVTVRGIINESGTMTKNEQISVYLLSVVIGGIIATIAFLGYLSWKQTKDGNASSEDDDSTILGKIFRDNKVTNEEAVEENPEVDNKKNK